MYNAFDSLARPDRNSGLKYYCTLNGFHIKYNKVDLILKINYCCGSLGKFVYVNYLILINTSF